jgi:hypothetical protein
VSEVRITNTGSGATYLLSDTQRTQFERELSRTAPWRTLRTLINFILGRDRYVPPLIAEDAEIEVVTDRGRTRRYRLFGRVVLQDVQTGRNRQFYMGALLVEWSENATAQPSPPPPP